MMVTNDNFFSPHIFRKNEMKFRYKKKLTYTRTHERRTELSRGKIRNGIRVKMQYSF